MVRRPPLDAELPLRLSPAFIAASREDDTVPSTITLPAVARTLADAALIFKTGAGFSNRMLPLLVAEILSLTAPRFKELEETLALTWTCCIGCGGGRSPWACSDTTGIADVAKSSISNPRSFGAFVIV